MTEEIPDEVAALVDKMASEYVQSEYEIAEALAAAEGPLTLGELVEETGYTERTVEKRTDTLEDRLGGEPLFQRDEDDNPMLHPVLARAIRNGADE
jgi:DNA-binding MarR family transcriptional regulator